MTQTPGTGNELESQDITNQEQQPKKTKKSKGKPILLGVGSLLFLGIGGGFAYGWFFLQKQLTPLIETELTNYLNRPIKIGSVESIGYGGLRFGASELPPTDTDPDKAVTGSVQVNFEPIAFLTQRHLNLDVTLINPDIYIEQDEQRKWVTTKIDSHKSSKEKPIKVEVKTIRLQNANLTLVGRGLDGKSNPPVTAKIRTVTSNFLEENEQDVVQFSLSGDLNKGGNFQIDGKAYPKTDVINLSVDAEQVNATEVTNLVALPVTFNTGKITGELGVNLSPDPTPLLNGELILDNATLTIANLTQSFSQSNGKLLFEDTQIKFKGVQTQFGQVSGTINGSLDTKGDYKISAVTQPTAILKVIESLKLKKPKMILAGDVQGQIQVTGALKKPKLNIDVATVKSSRVDRLYFKDVRAKMELIDTNLWVRDFIANPTVGGSITGKGVISLKKKADLSFDVWANKLPGNAIALLYGAKLGLDVGDVSGLVKVSAPTENLELLKLGSGSANFLLGGGVVTVSDIRYRGGDWQAKLAAKGVKFSSLPLSKDGAKKNNSPKTEQIQSKSNNALLASLENERLNGQFNVSINNNAFDLAQINATGVADFPLVGGRVKVENLQLNKGNWQAKLNLEKIQLSRLFPQAPSNSPFTGNLTINGNLSQSNLENLRISGNGNLPLAGGKIEAKSLALIDGNWQANIATNNLNLKSLYPQISSQFNGKIARGNFKINGNIASVKIKDIQALGEAEIILPGGKIKAKDLRLAKGKFNTIIQPKNFRLQSFSGKIPRQLNGTLKNGSFLLQGELDKLTPRQISAQGNGNILLPSGIVAANNFQLGAGKFTTSLTLENLNLVTLLELPGQLSGNIHVDGDIDNLMPEKLQATGNLNFSQGIQPIAPIDIALNTSLHWDGNRLEIERATGKGIDISGFVDVAAGFFTAVENEQRIANIPNFDFNVREANNINLTSLSALNPLRKQGINLNGTTDFIGKIAGNPQKPLIDGKLSVNNLNLSSPNNLAPEDLKIEPTLIGAIQINPQSGVDLQLIGDTNRLQLNLDANNRPISFFFNSMKPLSKEKLTTMDC